MADDSSYSGTDFLGQLRLALRAAAGVMSPEAFKANAASDEEDKRIAEQRLATQKGESDAKLAQIVHAVEAGAMTNEQGQQAAQAIGRVLPVGLGMGYEAKAAEQRILGEQSALTQSDALRQDLTSANAPVSIPPPNQPPPIANPDETYPMQTAVGPMGTAPPPADKLAMDTKNAIAAHGTNAEVLDLAKQAITNKHVTPIIRTIHKGDMMSDQESLDGGVTWHPVPDSSPYKSPSAVRVEMAANRGSSDAKPGTVEAVLARYDRSMKPIDNVQQQSEELRGLIASGSPASTIQIQKKLTQYMNDGRVTNQMYGDNKSFGTYPERFSNAISRFATGEYTEKDKNYALKLIDDMDKNVFNTARSNITKRFKMQGKKMGIDESVFDYKNPYGSSDAQTAPVSAITPADQALIDKWKPK